ncbi:MAG: hypothetical protein B7Z31_00135 [Rhodobacterales bacterium 12-65-15]|nr:MAG: hypothetical protein B7Z31_00135 [Rhodobacterales bacterium 12-65-15]
MPLNLKEAEVAAYADPSQENLAVYVKLLEEALAEGSSPDAELDRADRRIAELEDEVAELENELEEFWRAGK